MDATRQIVDEIFHWCNHLTWKGSPTEKQSALHLLPAHGQLPINTKLSAFSDAITQTTKSQAIKAFRQSRDLATCCNWVLCVNTHQPRRAPRPREPTAHEGHDVFGLGFHQDLLKIVMRIAFGCDANALPNCTR